MTKRSRQLSPRGAGAVGLMVALAALAIGCGPPVPTSPSYAANVRPIFESHCVRCHGAGGHLNAAREPAGQPDAGESGLGAPLLAYLGQYDDSGSCPEAGNQSACQRGAHYVATMTQYLQMALHGSSSYPTPMPPPPAPTLDDWELKVVDAWIANPIP
jgi:hypothetical protein